jgi:hypothetical protein
MQKEEQTKTSKASTSHAILDDEITSDEEGKNIKSFATACMMGSE